MQGAQSSSLVGRAVNRTNHTPEPPGFRGLRCLATAPLMSRDITRVEKTMSYSNPGELLERLRAVCGWAAGG
jgi:hypothetical protein